MGIGANRENEGTSLLKIEERKANAVLDEDGEVLGFHHDWPARELELLGMEGCKGIHTPSQ